MLQLQAASELTVWDLRANSIILSEIKLCVGYFV